MRGIIAAGTHIPHYRLDRTDGKLGLLYARKRDLPGDLEARFTAVLRATLEAAAAVEADAELDGALTFDAGSGALRIEGERAPLRQLSECFEMDFGGHEAALADLPGLASMYRVPNPTTADGRT